MKRVLVAVIWFVVLSLSGLGTAAIAGVIGRAKVRHTVQAANSSEGQAAGSSEGKTEAAIETASKYGTVILLGALVLSVVGTATGSLPGARHPSPR